ncbi:MAG: PilZ domain-containing protein [Woeseiaceae bacterium]|nr:PilZ domain-containing protein [Woeseiaceae bacterium]
MEAGSKRSIYRMSHNEPVRFLTDWRQTDGYVGHATDMSLAGMRLHSNHALGPGQFIRLVGKAMDSVAQVVHSAPRQSGWKASYEAGVRFITIHMLRSTGTFVSQQA